VKETPQFNTNTRQQALSTDYTPARAKNIYIFEFPKEAEERLHFVWPESSLSSRIIKMTPREGVTD
jgi:hypothetical protein